MHNVCRDYLKVRYLTCGEIKYQSFISVAAMHSLPPPDFR